MAQSFEEYKEEFQKNIPQGYILNEEKLEQLKTAFEKGEKINVEDYYKKDETKKEDSKKDEKDNSQNNDTPSKEDKVEDKKDENNVKKLVVNEGETAEEQKEKTSEDNLWKEAYAKEWRTWGEQNNLEFQDASVPSKGDSLSFRFIDGKEQGFAAEITYDSPYNIRLRGSDGKIPDSKYFEKAVSMAVNNGTAIEFGNIKSPEFKAKLLAACYKQGNAQIINGPTAEEMAAWPDDLKKMVEDAKAQAGKTAPEKEKETKTENKQEVKNEPTAAMKRIAELRKQIQDRQSKLDAAAKDISPEERKAIEQEGMSAEEIKLRELRGQAKEGDKKAASELYARREKTLTDEFKYEREVEGVKDGKPIYKKDKDGNFVYKQNDKGQKIETAAYKAFLKNLEMNKSR